MLPSKCWALMVWMLLACIWNNVKCDTNLPPIFTQVMNNIVLSESVAVGSVIFRLEGYDPEGSIVTFGYIGSEHFTVDPHSGNITLVKPLDREKKDSLYFQVTIKDQVNPDGRESEQDNVVSVPITVIVLDENDNPPEFQNTPYEADVNEDAAIGTTVFDKILLKDPDIIGDSLDVKCLAQAQSPNSCKKFRLEVLSREPTTLTASIVLSETLNYNERMIYHFQIIGTDGIHQSQTNFEARVKDIQDKAPVFYGSLSTVIDEDSSINTLLLKLQARDGDTGEPRKIVYDLLTNPMDYFLLDERTGELRTAKPLDREALVESTGLITLTIRAREVVNGVPINDAAASNTAKVTVTIRDVNDSPPTFNKKEFGVSLLENTANGTPLALEMNVTDLDVGVNSKFSLSLYDVSGVFEVEPQRVLGFSQVNIRVRNGTLDYENPNQRKFIVLVIAEETDTNPKLSSTATITISVEDTNDNKPIFEQESYSATVSESAAPGQYITSITAHDVDSGNYGDAGIRYSISGAGAEFFNINERTGALTLADCHVLQTIQRVKRDTVNSFFIAKDSNVDENHKLKENGGHDFDDNYSLLNNEISTVSPGKYVLITPANTKAVLKSETNFTSSETCLDYETAITYFLSFKATDDGGQGQTSVVSLRISVTDANDSPPVCESPLYRASIDEGALFFDSPLMVKARDVDTLSEVTYKIIGNKDIEQIFDIDKHSGQITIRPNATLDFNRLHTDNLVFQVEASDGKFVNSCGINITVRDVNNHSPRFLSEKCSAIVEENSEIGTSVEKLEAVDLDSGINAELRYRIQQGSFDDFRIDDITGEVFVSRKLDFDRRNTYHIEVLAIDMGTPSLSGTATLTVTINNTNDKDPYFTPATQHTEVREDAPVGTVIYDLIAIDPDVSSHTALEFAGTEITAIDRDGNEVKPNGEFKEFFSITRNGMVVVDRKLDINLFAVIRIKVLVTDSTAPTVQQGEGLLIIQIIDVNEIPPKFNLPWTVENKIVKLHMVEEKPIDTVLTTLQAYDEDSSIDEYNISDNPYFKINKTSGIITSTSRIDYESVKEVKFVVTVTDTGVPALTSTADVIVDIVNLNDNEPHFSRSEYHFNVTENPMRGTLIGKVEAFDSDIGSFGEINYSLIGENSKYFSIDSYTGNIIVGDSNILDYEKINRITLTAVVHDKAPETVSKSSTAAVYINILDLNDNAPIFTQTEYTSTVAENAASNPPAALLQVKAEDLDEGIYGEIHYVITAGNEAGLFKLDPHTGIVYPAQSLDGKKGVYILTISARDNQGSGAMDVFTRAIITVMDINQHRPVFIIPALSNATIEVPGDIIKADYLILIVRATDNDLGENGKISYHLQLNNQNLQETDVFKIDPNSGELRTKKELNRKECPNYDIILVARDSGNPAPFETLRFLSISIVDVNDNRPEFSDAANPYKISITENSGREVKVGRIQAKSRSKHLRDVFYYMLLGNEDGAFFLDRRTGDIFTNKSLDREITDTYTLYILASIKPDLHISEEERASFSIKTLERDITVAKVRITVLDVNDNAPVFERQTYYAGINAKSSINGFVTVVNATDEDCDKNAKTAYMIISSNLYKFGSTKSMGSIVPSPFSVSPEGRITTAAFMAEYNQDRFELEVVANEIESPERSARTKVIIWVFDSSQQVRVIISRSPEVVYHEQEEIIAELRNATQHRIIVDEIRFHVDTMGRIRMDWSDMFFHAVDHQNQQIAPVDEILKVIDESYDYLKDYYAGFAIENVVPAYVRIVQDEFDLALAGLVALIIVLFVGVISFLVLCCCLKHWNLSVPAEARRKDALIKKQIIEDLNTTENPLWIEQKLKLYEEQELTMQVFSEPDHNSNLDSPGQLDLRTSIDHLHQTVDNTYATIKPRNSNNSFSNGGGERNMNNDFVGYASLRTNRQPSMYEFTGSTFQAPVRDGDDVVAELV